MGNSQVNKKFKTISDKIPLPNTVKDIDPNLSYKLSTKPCCLSDGLTDNKLLSIASILYKNGITDYDPFKIVSLQSLIDSGLCIPQPLWLGGYIWVFRLIFSEDLQYLPVGDIIVNAVTNINGGNRLSYASRNDFTNLNGMGWTNSVFELDCKTNPFVDLSESVISCSSTYLNYNKNNPIDYTKPLSSMYMSTAENNPWWKLTLPNDIQINQVDILNRIDGDFVNLANAVITIKNKNGNIIFTQNFSKRVSLLYVFTPNVVGNEITISKAGTNVYICISKIIINKNFKSLGWYTDNSDRTLLRGKTSANYLDTINKYKEDYKIVAQQNGLESFLGQQCIDNLNSKTDYKKLDKQSLDFNRNGNMKFDDIPVLLVKNDVNHSKVIPNNVWSASAISWKWGDMGNWGCLEIRGNKLNGDDKFINFGTVFCVGDGDNAWKINGRNITPQSNLPGDYYNQLVTNRVYCAINSDFLVCLSEIFPTDPLYNKDGSSWINERSVGGKINAGGHDHIFTYTSPFGTFSALNGDDNSQLGGSWNQNYKYYDIRPDILNLFCCSALSGDSKNILKRDLDLNNFDLSTYCLTTKYGSNKCNDVINDKCYSPDDIKKEYKDRATQQLYSPCKQIFLKNQGGAWDELAKNYANSYPDDNFSSCIKPKIPIDASVPEVIKNYLINNPRCGDTNCASNGYKIQNMVNTDCNIQYVNCITTIDSRIGTGTNNKITMNNNVNCGINTNSNSPVNCEYNPWGNCNNGVQTRTIKTQASNGGTPCDNSKLSQSCIPVVSNVDCETSNWSECKNNLQTRTIITQPSGNGSSCGILSRSCNQEVFHISGYDYTKQEALDKCKLYNADLATDSQLKDAYNKGAEWCSTGWLKDSDIPKYPMQTSKPGCGNIGISEYLPTNNKAGINCYGARPTNVSNILPFNDNRNTQDVDCVVSNWGECKNNLQTRTITTQPSGNGSSCGILSRSCSSDVNCVVSDWGECKNNLQTRTIITQPSGNGSSCGILSRSCNQEVFHISGYDYTKQEALDKCKLYNADLATDSQLKDAYNKGAEWCSTGWLKDSDIPKYPMQTSKPGCGNIGISEYLPTNNKAGINCYGVRPTNVSNLLPFNNNNINTQDCVVSDWGECKNNLQTRTIITQPSGNGSSCGILSRSCGSTNTNINCEVSNWGSCNNGTQTRTITKQPSGNGSSCPVLSQTCSDSSNSSSGLTSKQKLFIYIVLGVVGFLFLILFMVFIARKR